MITIVNRSKDWTDKQMREAEDWAMRNKHAIPAARYTRGMECWLLTFSGFHRVSSIVMDYWIHTGHGLDSSSWACHPQTFLYDAEAVKYLTSITRT